MSRLVVVSNRLPIGRPKGNGSELELPAGGLVSALLAALAAVPESLWVGWDRRVPPGGNPSRHIAGTVTLVGLPLERAQVEGYYDGFCNQALWPILHYFPGRGVFDPRHLASYLAVQERFGLAVAKRLRVDDVVWIHDYHLLGLASVLRRQGVGARLGFFLHTPFPPLDLWAILPQAKRFLAALFDFDLVGFHTRSYFDNYVHACCRELGASWDGAVLRFGERRQEVGVFPVGIDVEAFAPSPEVARRALRPGRLTRMVQGRRVILGVDRLDYTKGLPERCRAFGMFLREHPEWQDRVCLVQIASPSRGNLPGYARERQEIEQLVGRINGEFGRPDWVPIRYLYRSFPREELVRFYRSADVGMVTPLRDGMNLVAREYVAAQLPDRPGVLVLSRFAGAAESLVDAIRVNPYVPAECAEALREALLMPIDERLHRQERLLEVVRRESAAAWANSFLTRLSGRPLGDAARAPG
ncbi:MAG TPA: trehalose-6-phosphate synthase [Thermoanaerobaculia bacterium]|nr:trehalose-6-phosphate synthase [Thermoanaerobaculia bacterium]